jgi:hypothetical protein
MRAIICRQSQIAGHCRRTTLQCQDAIRLAPVSMGNDKLNAVVARVFSGGSIPPRHENWGKKLPSVRRSLRDEIRRSRSVLSSRNEDELIKAEALSCLLDELKLTDIETLFLSRDWEWMLGALVGIISGSSTKTAEHAATTLTRNLRRLFSSECWMSRCGCIGNVSFSICTEEYSVFVVRLAAFARARVLAVPVLLRRLFMLAMNVEDPRIIAQSPFWDALQSHPNDLTCAHHLFDGCLSFGLILERLAQSLACFARERDQISLGVLLDQTFRIWDSIGTEHFAESAPLPWVLQASAPIQAACMPRQTLCPARQRDVAAVSSTAILAILLHDVDLTVDMRKEVLRKMATTSLPMVTELESVRPEAGLNTPRVADWLLESLIENLSNEPHLVCQILLKNWNLGGHSQIEHPKLFLDSAQTRSLVHKLTLGQLPFTVSHCEPALRLLTELLCSAELVKNIHENDFESCLFVTAILLLNKPWNTLSDALASGPEATPRDASAEHLCETLWRTYGDMLLSAMMDAFRMIKLRWLVLFFMVRSRCQKALASHLVRCNHTEISEFIQVALMLSDPQIADHVQVSLRSAERTLAFYREEDFGWNKNAPQKVIRDALHAAASLVERRATSHVALDETQFPKESNAAGNSAPSAITGKAPADTRAWALAMLVHSLGPRAFADQAVSDLLESVLQKVPSEHFLTIRNLHELMNDEILRHIRQATEAELRCERLQRRHAEDQKALMERIRELETEKYSIEQSLTCMVCFDRLRAPLALAPCGHVLCKKCFVALTTEHRTHLCPTCRQAFDPLAAIRVHLI